MLDALADENCLYLIFPSASGGDLFDAVSGTEGGMEEGVARSYFTDMVQGLSWLKMNGMAHGDVSLENVVVCVEEEEVEGREGGAFAQKVMMEDEEEEEEERRRREGGRKTCRLIDLEMARFLPQEATKSARRRARAGLRNAGGKRGYIAPECVDGTVSDWLAADIWSLGICLYTMLTRHPLYLNPEELGFELLCRGEAGRVIEYYRTEHGLGLSAAAAELVEWMLCPHPEGRPTLEQVLGHEWVRGGGREEGWRRRRGWWWRWRRRRWRGRGREGGEMCSRRRRWLGLGGWWWRGVRRLTFRRLRILGVLTAFTVVAAAVWIAAAVAAAAAVGSVRRGTECVGVVRCAWQRKTRGRSREIAAAAAAAVVAAVAGVGNEI